MTTLLGFDYGTRKIGVAVGQTITATATALTVVRVRDARPDWDAIAALVREWRPSAAVLGLPMQMDDTEEHFTPLVRRFGRQLSGRFGLPVYLVDERLTTREAQRQLGVGHDARVDAEAARLILETWLTEQPTDA